VQHVCFELLADEMFADLFRDVGRNCSDRDLAADEGWVSVEITRYTT